MDGVAIDGPVLVFDDDDYYMGGVLAETLRKRGLEVILATPSPLVSAWTVNTLEQEKIQRQVLEAGITVMANSNLAAVRPGEAELACVFTGRRQVVAAASVVLVTARRPRTDLYDALSGQIGQGSLRTLLRIGDCFQPGTIATAVFGGRRAAEGLDQPAVDIVGFRTEPVATERPLRHHNPDLRAAE
jgi:dimethylamine/trimethylamine dehydrogenase